MLARSTSPELVSVSALRPFREDVVEAAAIVRGWDCERTDSAEVVRESGSIMSITMLIISDVA